MLASIRCTVAKKSYLSSTLRKDLSSKGKEDRQRPQKNEVEETEEEEEEEADGAVEDAEVLLFKKAVEANYLESRRRAQVEMCKTMTSIMPPEQIKSRGV